MCLCYQSILGLPGCPSPYSFSSKFGVLFVGWFGVFFFKRHLSVKSLVSSVPTVSLLHFVLLSAGINRVKSKEAVESPLKKSDRKARTIA